MVKKRTLLVILATVAVVIGLVGAVVVYQFSFRQRAEIEAVSMIRVFYDAAQTQEVQQGTVFNWGKIGSGTWLLTLYVNNTGNVPVILSYDYRRDQLPGDWVEFWDDPGTALQQNELRQVTITLVVPTYISAGTWEWDCWIRATPTQ